MSDTKAVQQTTDADAATPSLVNLAFLIYLLHGASLIIGISTAATIVGAFVFGWPSIIAVILNYAKRRDVAGTYLESHFRWQIRTFWFCLLWLLLGLVTTLILVGFVIIALTGLWAMYRIIRGWLALRDGRAVAA